jgi:hypothetical protein
MRERERRCPRERAGPLRWFTFLFFLDLTIAAHGSGTRPLSGFERCVRLVFFDWPFACGHQRAVHGGSQVCVCVCVYKSGGGTKGGGWESVFAVVKFARSIPLCGKRT